MKLSIVGSGYVGVVTGACLAEKGHSVICVDVDEDKVAQINSAVPPIHEIGLRELLVRHVPRNLRATTDLHQAVLGTDVTMIAVGTPFDGQAIDLSFVNEAAAQIGRTLRSKASYHVVVVKSTVVPGTTDGVVGPILEEASGKRVGVEFGLAMNPEFLTEGQAVDDFLRPDRIVIGGADGKSIEAVEDLYHGFNCEVIRTNNKTAEMIKYASNALLATMISFSNEIANLCSALGNIDVTDVMRGVHLSRYLSTDAPGAGIFEAPITGFLKAGCGFGGSCLPKDVNALIAHGKRAGSPMELLEAVVRINERQPEKLLCALKKHFPTLAGVRVAVLGLAFKPDTTDMRQSPAIPVIMALLAEQAKVKAYDPVAQAEARKIFVNRGLELCDDLHQAVSDADAVVLVTAWQDFKALPDILKQLNREPLVLDGRRMLDKHAVARYAGIGL